jgi:hypothetical protein
VVKTWFQVSLISLIINQCSEENNFVFLYMSFDKTKMKLNFLFFQKAKYLLKKHNKNWKDINITQKIKIESFSFFTP